MASITHQEDANPETVRLMAAKELQTVGDLITHKQAAAMIQTVTEKRLRERDANGEWVFAPDQLARYQEKPGAKNLRGTTIWFLREQVEAFIERRNQAMREAVAKPAVRPIKVSADEIAREEAAGHRSYARALRELAALR